MRKSSTLRQPGGAFGVPFSRFPYRRQITDAHCGPACVQMYLLSIGKLQSQVALWKLLRTNSKVGTSRKDMIRFLRRAGFHVRVWPHMAKAQLMQEIAVQPILVRYHEEAGPDEHYAIAIGTTKRGIVLHDPWTGPRHVIPWNIFLPLWQKSARQKQARGWALRARPPRKR